jgi:hypothetical protein
VRERCLLCACACAQNYGVLCTGLHTTHTNIFLSSFQLMRLQSSEPLKNCAGMREIYPVYLLSIFLLSASGLHWRTATPAELKVYWSQNEICYMWTIIRDANEVEKYRDIFEYFAVNCSNYLRSTCSTESKCYVGKSNYRNLHGDPAWPEVLQKVFIPENATSCTSSLIERLPFWISVWGNLPSPRSGLTHFESFLKTTSDHKMNRISFMGDSISHQALNTFRHLNNGKANVIKASYDAYLPCGLTKVGAGARTPSTCFTSNQTLCTDENQAKYIVSRNSMKNAIFFFQPFGTHVWNVPRDVRNSRGVAMGVIAAAKNALASGSVIIIFECQAQHFVYDRDLKTLKPQADLAKSSGIFLPDVPYARKRVRGRCCEKTTPSELGNYRNVALFADLDKLDPTWRSYTGVVPFYDQTQPLFFSHIESHLADCVHFTWAPAFWEHVWYHLEAEFLRLKPLIKNV